jgi:hypothetical protein
MPVGSATASWWARASFTGKGGVTRRRKFLIVGANNEGDAQELAGRIRREAPADATVCAERSAVYLPFTGF